MNPQDKYREYCGKHPDIPIFSQDWWLDSVCETIKWDVALVEKNGKIIASMPYIIKQWGFFTLLTMPPLTQNLGPWISEDKENYSKRLSDQKKIMNIIIDQLPYFDIFIQNWHYSQTNWLPFYWRGFQQTTRYTYSIQGLNDLDRLLKNFDSSYRNKIRKAQKIVNVKLGLAVDKFYEINMKTFQRQGLAEPYTLDFIKKHHFAIKTHNQGEIFYAIDQNEKIHSALYLIWDSQSSYVHMVGENPELRNSGAGILLVWEAIKYTRDVLKLDTFDFEGSMIEAVECVRRDCGGEQVPYFQVTSMSRRMKFLMAGRDMIKALTGYER